MPRVVHFEVHAEDPERAIRFYEAVLGWRFQRYGEAPYWLIITGEEGTPGINGGLVPRRGKIDGTAVIAIVCTVDVDDLDATLAWAERAGAVTALPKQAVPGVGWLAYVKDTEGNIFGMLQSDRHAK
jgi:predicted enzyme related to lactoylglutathione lyase